MLLKNMLKSSFNFFLFFIINLIYKIKQKIWIFIENLLVFFIWQKKQIQKYFSLISKKHQILFHKIKYFLFSKNQISIIFFHILVARIINFIPRLLRIILNLIINIINSFIQLIFILNKYRFNCLFIYQIRSF